MLSLIILLVFGAIIAFVSIQNTAIVSLTFLEYTLSNIPLYSVIIGSMLVGVILAYLISFINSISTSMLIRTQHKKIGQEKREIMELTRRVHQLELENVGLKIENNPSRIDQKAL